MKNQVIESVDTNEKIEYSVKMHIYVNLREQIGSNDCMNMGYTICEYIKEMLPDEDNVEVYVHESCINEDVEDSFELKVLCTFYFQICNVNEEMVLDRFVSLLPKDISNINDNIVATDDINIQIHQYEKFKK